jgi:hypothetical protein
VPVAVAAAITVTLTKIAVTIAIEAVFMFAAASVTFPISSKKTRSVMVRSDPPGARIGRASPVTPMPLIVPALRIPVSVDPNELGARTHGTYFDARGRRRADLYPE